MKIIILTLALLTTLTINLFSQSGWQLLNPLPISCSLNSVKFVNSNTGYAVGSKGIAKTTDGGMNWFKLSDTGFYRSSFFVNAATGWIAGNYIKKTTDGGYSWVIQQSLNNEYKNSLYFVNENTGWHVGSQTIYKTTDGGGNWFLQNGFGAQNMSDVFFIDANTGWIGRGGNSIAKTTDGGNNWIITTTGYYSYSLFFINALTGYAGGSNSFIKTTNGGMNWVYVSGTSLNAGSMQFINEYTGWVTGNANYIARVLKTTNGGLNWIVQTFGRSEVFTSLCFTDNNTGWLVGDGGEILKTTNSGVNWIYKNTDILYHFYSVFFTDANTGFAAGSKDTSGFVHSLIYKTTDGGYNWVAKSPDVPNTLWSLFFINTNTGWSVGSNSRILKTTNAGENWVYQLPDSTVSLYSVYFVNQNTGWAAGTQVLKTTNGGANWNYQANNYTSSLSFYDANTGWSLNYGARINRTTNGGLNWAVIDLPIWWQNYPAVLQFVNSQTGFVTGGLGNMIFKSTNGGINWFSVATPVEAYEAAYFPSLNTGYVSGQINIMKTINQGETWTVSDYPSDKNIYAMHFINDNTGWAVGRQGLIMKTTTGGVGIKPVSSIVPVKFELFQNYPNPFNPVTRIKFDIPEKGNWKMQNSNVTLSVFDITGRKVAEPVNEILHPGSYEVSFDGSRLSSGVYFYKLASDNFSIAKKMVLIK